MASTLTTLPLPPYVSHRPARPIPISQALSLIQAYLSASSTSPHLHPDCIFTEHGPSFSSSSSTGGLVLHQLRRVEAGLRGERLGAEPDPADIIIDADGTVSEIPASNDSRLDSAAQTTTILSDDGEEEGGVGDNTQPPRHGETFRFRGGQPAANAPDSYMAQMAEQRVGDLVDDYGERSNVVGDAGHGARIPTVHSTKRGHEDERGSKEARKAAKKMRMKDERRAGGGVRGAAPATDDMAASAGADNDALEMPTSATPGRTWRADGVGAQQANADLDAGAMDVDMPDVETLAAELDAPLTTTTKVVSQAEGMMSEQTELESKEQRRVRKKARREGGIAAGAGGGGEGTGGGFDVAREVMRKKGGMESKVVDV